MGVDDGELTIHCLRPDIDEGGTGIETIPFLWNGRHSWSWSAVDQLTDKKIAAFWLVLIEYIHMWIMWTSHFLKKVWDVWEPKNWVPWDVGFLQERVSKSRHKAGSFPPGDFEFSSLQRATLWGSAGFGSSDHHTDAEDLQWGNWVKTRQLRRIWEVGEWSCWCFPFWLLGSTFRSTDQPQQKTLSQPWDNRSQPICWSFWDSRDGTGFRILKRLHPLSPVSGSTGLQPLWWVIKESSTIAGGQGAGGCKLQGGKIATRHTHFCCRREWPHHTLSTLNLRQE